MAQHRLPSFLSQQISRQKLPWSRSDGSEVAEDCAEAWRMALTVIAMPVTGSIISVFYRKENTVHGSSEPPQTPLVKAT
jgi:hypothetical protein